MHINSCIVSWAMALQGYDSEVRYAQNHKMALVQDLAKCHHCDYESQSSSQPLLVITSALPSYHHYYDENIWQGLPRAYVDSCSFYRESQLKAGVGIFWIG